jgi:large subunit ribosomal protein L9
VNVARSEDEATRQARGEDVTAGEAGEDAAESAAAEEAPAEESAGEEDREAAESTGNA